MDGARSRFVARAIVAGSVVVPVWSARLATRSRKVDTPDCVRRTSAGADPLETSRRECATPRGRLRDGHSEILTQSLAGILLAEQAAALEFRHDEANEVFVSSRNVRRGNNKAVAGALDKPLFAPVCNLLRAADDRVMHATAAAEMDEVAHCRILLPARLHDAIADRLQPGHFRQLSVCKRLVHALSGKVE